jgi:hypothetical protein
MSNLDYEKIQASLQTEEAQWFQQIRNLAGHAVSPKVWHRYFGGDFMAEVPVVRRGNTRPRMQRSTGDSIEGALNALASVVAAYLFPPEATPIRSIPREDQ